MVLPITDRPIWKGRLPRWQARATQCFVVRGLLRRLPPALHIVAAVGLHSLSLAQRVRGCPLTRAHGVAQHARHKPMAGTRGTRGTPAVAVFLAAAPTFVRAHLLAPVLACLANSFGKHPRKTLPNVDCFRSRQNVFTHARFLHAQAAGAVRVQPTLFVHGLAPCAVVVGGD